MRRAESSGVVTTQGEGEGERGREGWRWYGCVGETGREILYQIPRLIGTF